MPNAKYVIMSLPNLPINTLSSRESGLRGPDLHHEKILVAVSVGDTDYRRGACDLS